MEKTCDRGLESSALEAVGFGHHFQAQVTISLFLFAAVNWLFTHAPVSLNQPTIHW